MEYNTQAQFNQQAQQQPPMPPRPDSNLVWAILSTVLCCLPLGIVSIVYASKVDSLYSAGRYTEAQQASADAKKWAIISAVSCAIGLLLYFVFFVMLAGLGALS